MLKNYRDDNRGLPKHIMKGILKGTYSIKQLNEIYGLVDRIYRYKCRTYRIKIVIGLLIYLLLTFIVLIARPLNIILLLTLLVGLLSLLIFSLYYNRTFIAKKKIQFIKCISKAYPDLVNLYK